MPIEDGRRRRWRPEEAEERMREAGLEPQEAFPGVRKPWRSRCLECGSIAMPRLGGILAGQGGCVRCGAAKVATAARGRMLDPAEAVAVMEAAGVTPLVPYPGASAPWLSRCVVCGNQGSPTLAHVRARKRGCRFCATHGFDYSAPAMVYVIIHPDLGAVKIGIGACSGQNSRLLQHQRTGWLIVYTQQYATGAEARDVEGAILPRLSELGVCPFLTPEQMPNGWSETADAKRISAEAVWAMVLEHTTQEQKAYIPAQGQRRRSAAAMSDPKQAKEELRAAGWEPLEPYPGYVNRSWRSRCTRCGTEGRPRLNAVRRGGGCGVCHRAKTATEQKAAMSDGALEVVRSAGYEPLAPYPGSSVPWRCRCTRCGEESAPRYSNVLTHGTTCVHCAGQARTAPERAETELRAAGFEPLEPYPGYVGKPWRSRCMTCGTEVTPRLSSIRNGTGCRACSARERGAARRGTTYRKKDDR